MSNLTTAVNPAPGGRPHRTRTTGKGQRQEWSADQCADFAHAMKEADKQLRAGQLHGTIWAVYHRVTTLAVAAGLPYTTADAHVVSRGIKGCSAEYLTCVYRKLRRAGFVRRQQVGRSWRTYIVALEPAPAPAPIIESPAARRSALVLGALALLHQAAALVRDPAALVRDPAAQLADPMPAPPAPALRDTAPVDGAFFVPLDSDPKAGSNRLTDRITPPCTDSLNYSPPNGGVNSRAADPASLSSSAAKGQGGGVDNSARPERPAPVEIPETASVQRLRSCGVESGDVLVVGATLQLADVERLILAVDFWPEPVRSRAGLLSVLVVEGLWPSRAAQIAAALARAEAAQARAAGPPMCCWCRVAVVPAVGDACCFCVQARTCPACELELVPMPGARCWRCTLDATTAAQLVAAWGRGVDDPGGAAPVPDWLARAAGGGP